MAYVLAGSSAHFQRRLLASVQSPCSRRFLYSLNDFREKYPLCLDLSQECPRVTAYEKAVSKFGWFSRFITAPLINALVFSFNDHHIKMRYARMKNEQDGNLRDPSTIRATDQDYFPNRFVAGAETAVHELLKRLDQATNLSLQQIRQANSNQQDAFDPDDPLRHIIKAQLLTHMSLHHSLLRSLNLAASFQLHSISNTTMGRTWMCLGAKDIVSTTLNHVPLKDHFDTLPIARLAKRSKLEKAAELDNDGAQIADADRNNQTNNDDDDDPVVSRGKEALLFQQGPFELLFEVPSDISYNDDYSKISGNQWFEKPSSEAVSQTYLRGGVAGIEVEADIDFTVTIAPALENGPIEPANDDTSDENEAIHKQQWSMRMERPFLLRFENDHFTEGLNMRWRIADIDNWQASHLYEK